MGVNEKINQLLAEWKNRYEDTTSFCSDGLIDEANYRIASKKILFLQKEPNIKEGGDGWDFRVWWNEKIKYTFTTRITEWAFGLLNDFPQYDEIWKDYENAHNALKSVAFMDLKKTGGSGTASYSVMKMYVDRDLDLIYRQIDLIDPEIIITGTSWRELRNSLFPETDWKESGYDIAIGLHRKAKVIDFYHPSARNAPAAAYSLLQNVIQGEAYKKLED